MNLNNTYFYGVKNMNIKINTICDINQYFGEMCTDDLISLYNLLGQYNQLYIDQENGELIGDGTRLGIYTDYFLGAKHE